MENGKNSVHYWVYLALNFGAEATENKRNKVREDLKRAFASVGIRARADDFFIGAVGTTSVETVIKMQAILEANPLLADYIGDFHMMRIDETTSLRDLLIALK